MYLKKPKRTITWKEVIHLKFPALPKQVATCKYCYEKLILVIQYEILLMQVGPNISYQYPMRNKMRLGDHQST